VNAARRTEPGRIELLIAGLGNLLLADDGVGVHAVRALRGEDIGEGVLVVEVGTAALDALPLFEAARRVIALDAVQAGGEPGSIYELDLEGVETGREGHSLHELGLREVFRMIPAEKRPGLRILGVEPAVIDFGMELSPAVLKALPAFLQTARDAARNWLS